MFLSAAIFAFLLILIAGFMSYGIRETRRILETGRKMTVTVLSKHRDSKKTSPVVEIRLDEVPDVEPFWRTLRGIPWEGAQPGDKLSYVYEAGDPRGGVLGTPDLDNSLPCFFAAGSVLVLPFLVVGTLLKRRELRLRTPSSS
jgi:hypothetical protein